MDLRKLSPVLDQAMAQQAEADAQHVHAAGLEGAKARFALAFGEQALGAIVAEFIRETPKADVITAMLTVTSALMANVLVNVSDDEDICSFVAKLWRERLHDDFQTMKAGNRAGVTIKQDREHGPLVVTRTGVPS